MSVPTAAAWLWGCAIGLAINLATIHSPRAAVVGVFTFALIFIAAVLYDEWRHPASMLPPGHAWAYTIDPSPTRPR